MIKILHSADWHLDSPMMQRTPEQAQMLRSAMASIPSQLAAACRQEKCDLVLLSGDLFDGAYAADSLQQLQQALEEMSVPVFISPGNHDFISPDSPENLNPQIVGGLNLYSYANNNPINRIKNFGTSVNGVFLGSSSEEYAGGLLLNIVDWLIDNSTTIYSSVHSLVNGVPILSHILNILHSLMMNSNYMVFQNGKPHLNYLM